MFVAKIQNSRLPEKTILAYVQNTMFDAKIQNSSIPNAKGELSICFSTLGSAFEILKILSAKIFHNSSKQTGQLYEASHLAHQGETLLVECRAFPITYLIKAF